MARKHNKKPAIVKQWDEYFQNDDLENWQRLMKDLGLEGEFRSSEKVWVNIYDFLEAVRADRLVHRFATEALLSRYTQKTGKIFPKKHVKKSSPLASLMAHIFR
ncbi:hypothetical protein PG995_002505 [Apiospora arundinis]